MIRRGRGRQAVGSSMMRMASTQARLTRVRHMRLWQLVVPLLRMRMLIHVSSVSPFDGNGKERSRVGYLVRPRLSETLMIVHPRFRGENASRSSRCR
jgi:hypothetical protein